MQRSYRNLSSFAGTKLDKCVCRLDNVPTQIVPLCYLDQMFMYCVLWVSINFC